MASYLQKISTAIIVVITFPAWAGHNNDRFPVPTIDTPQYDFAKVVDVQPVIEVVQVPQEQQVCRQQAVQRRVAEHRSPAPAIFGAIIGGVIGNQLSRGHRRGHGHGHGNNRAVGTVAGAAIGSAFASEVQYSQYPRKYYTENAQLCRMETTWRSEERVVAWDVSWKYRGQVFHSRMDEPPGDRIRVKVSVVPAYR